MKNGFFIFLAAFIGLGASWCGFVLAPVRQLGGAKQTAILNTTDSYPLQRTGEAALGLQVYRANGCVACHTEQVRQTGIVCDVLLTGVGPNPEAVVAVVAEIGSQSHDLSTNHLPHPVCSRISRENADRVAGKISAAGGTVEVQVIAAGADIERGWGKRRSVAGDYLYDQPVQPGSLRAGPDLANIGVRAPDANGQLVHLYAPQAVVKGSTMPPYRYLFEIRKAGAAPSADALRLPKEIAPPAGYEVVPQPEAKQLAAYLLSLRANAPLYSAPVSP
jgi:cbb3-type cytochrome oxidase cytochrome c subunit